MTKKRILLFIKGLGVGGAEMLLVNSIPYLDRDSFDYEVAYMLPWKDDLVSRFENAGIPVHQLGGSRGRIDRSIGELRSIVSDRAFDLVDAHLPVPGLVSRLALRKGSTALIYHEHSLSVQRRLSRGRIFAFTANVLTYGMSNVIVAVSEDTAQDVRRFNRSKTPVRVIPNGIPLPEKPDSSVVLSALDSLDVPRDHMVVGHVAKMVSKKRQADLIDAAVLVLQRRPNTVFLLIGVGPDRPALEARARRMGVSNQVFFPGFVDDLTSVMAGFDLFVLTSLHEGLPTVVIEAQSLGIPVVATDVGGTAEIVSHSRTGLLVPARRPREVAEAVLRLLDDDEMRSSMSLAAKSKALVFDIERCVRETETLYREVLPT